MSQIINYAEYLMATTGKHAPVRPRRDMTSEEEAAFEERVKAYHDWYIESVESAPDWFNMWQDKAIALMRKKIAQVHLFPRNRKDFLDLKTEMWVEQGTGIAHQEPYNYQECVRNAIAEQIKFMYENSTYMDNGYLNSSNTFVIGTFTQGGQSPQNIDRLFNQLCPMAYNYLEEIGWMYSSLTDRLDSNIFYRGEH